MPCGALTSGPKQWGPDRGLKLPEPWPSKLHEDEHWVLASGAAPAGRPVTLRSQPGADSRTEGMFAQMILVCYLQQPTRQDRWRGKMGSGRTLLCLEGRSTVTDGDTSDLGNVPGDRLQSVVLWIGNVQNRQSHQDRGGGGVTANGDRVSLWGWNCSGTE